MKACKSAVRNSRSGMTLVEVVIGMILTAMLASVIFTGITQAVKVNYSSAQHMAAFGLCRQRLEQMRGVAFTSVTESNFPEEDVTLTHLGGSARVPLMCTRSSSISELNDPLRKTITVNVAWTFRGWSLDEQASGIIFYKDGSAAELSNDHLVGGQININPNSRPDNEFTLTLADGTVVTRDDLTLDYPGYSGAAQLCHVRPKGAGNQNAMILDGQPFPVENGYNLDISSDAMTVNLYNDSINPLGKAVGQWWISITASGAEVTVF